jgi:mycoredoxin
MSEDVVVYFKPGCPFAAKLRIRLRLSRIRYRSVSFKSDPAGASAVRAANNGSEISPTVRVRDQLLANPTVEQVRSALRASAQS